MNNLLYIVCNFIYTKKEYLESLFSETHPLYSFGKEVKYRALALLFIYIFVFLVIFISSQSNSEDFSSKDERLGSSSLGVKKAG